MSQSSSELLAARRYVSLVTFRRNGNGVPTPVWIAGVDGKLYVVTNATSAKMKRLKANDRVRLSPCDARGNVSGERIEGRGKRVIDIATMERALDALERKYGWQMGVLKFFSRLSGRAKDRAFIEIILQD
jgi:uncharacterized protein